MTIAEKPRHLQSDYASQFCDESIVAAYPARPPYPGRVFELLASLATDAGNSIRARGERAPRRVLELGAGTGDITFGLAARVELVDAVEPSPAMVAAATKRASEHSRGIRWLLDTAENFEPVQPYSLVVAAESLHWMDWALVLPKIASCLLPGGVLAIVTVRAIVDLPWHSELRELVPRFSTNQDYRTYEIVQELSDRGLFHELGREVIVSAPFSQSLDEYVESFHSRNGFSRARMNPDSAASFDAEVQKLVRAHRSDDRVEGPVRTTVVWGVPGATRI